MKSLALVCVAAVLQILVRVVDGNGHFSNSGLFALSGGSGGSQSTGLYYRPNDGTKKIYGPFAEEVMLDWWLNGYFEGDTRISTSSLLEDQQCTTIAQFFDDRFDAHPSDSNSWSHEQIPQHQGQHQHYQQQQEQGLGQYPSQGHEGQELGQGQEQQQQQYHGQSSSLSNPFAPEHQQQVHNNYNPQNQHSPHDYEGYLPQQQQEYQEHQEQYKNDGYNNNRYDAPANADRAERAAPSVTAMLNKGKELVGLMSDLSDRAIADLPTDVREVTGRLGAVSQNVKENVVENVSDLSYKAKRWVRGSVGVGKMSEFGRLFSRKAADTLSDLKASVQETYGNGQEQQDFQLQRQGAYDNGQHQDQHIQYGQYEQYEQYEQPNSRPVVPNMDNNRLANPVLEQHTQYSHEEPGMDPILAMPHRGAHLSHMQTEGETQEVARLEAEVVADLHESHESPVQMQAEVEVKAEAEAREVEIVEPVAVLAEEAADRAVYDSDISVDMAGVSLESLVELESLESLESLEPLEPIELLDLEERNTVAFYAEPRQDSQDILDVAASLAANNDKDTRQGLQFSRNRFEPWADMRDQSVDATLSEERNVGKEGEKEEDKDSSFQVLKGGIFVSSAQQPQFAGSTTSVGSSTVSAEIGPDLDIDIDRDMGSLDMSPTQEQFHQPNQPKQANQAQQAQQYWDHQSYQNHQNDHNHQGQRDYQNLQNLQNYQGRSQYIDESYEADPNLEKRFLWEEDERRVGLSRTLLVSSDIFLSPLSHTLSLSASPF